MVPATGALQQCVGISPPVLEDHPDGCKPAEEVSTKCVPGVFDALVRSVCLGCVSEQREHSVAACVLCHWVWWRGFASDLFRGVFSEKLLGASLVSNGTSASHLPEGPATGQG